MGTRLELQDVLESVLGSTNVYFQPPESVRIKYDAIIYNRDMISPEYADNSPYQLYDRYSVTAVYRDPDSDLPHKLALLPLCRHNRHYTSDNLNHDVFELYF